MRPLCVDMDGTIIFCDLLWVSMRALLRRNPLFLFAIPLWWIFGRPHLKRELASRVTIDPVTLPYNKSFVEYLRKRHAAGDDLLLVTGSDELLARPVADYLGVFSRVIGSDGKRNCSSFGKVARLREELPGIEYDYAGDAFKDLPVWRAAHTAVLVNAGPKLIALVKAQKKNDVFVFEGG